jgi:hypothetical protein
VRHLSTLCPLRVITLLISGMARCRLSVSIAWGPIMSLRFCVLGSGPEFTAVRGQSFDEKIRLRRGYNCIFVDKFLRAQ